MVPRFSLNIFPDVLVVQIDTSHQNNRMYEIATVRMSQELEKIHNIFHVSMLKRYRSDPSHIISAENIDVQPDLTYEEEPVRILAREVKELQNKQIPLVKVLWRYHNIEEATWESNETMRQQFP